MIEKEINCGQLEELIEQAEDELSVIPVYLGAYPLLRGYSVGAHD